MKPLKVVINPVTQVVRDALLQRQNPELPNSYAASSPKDAGYDGVKRKKSS